MDSTTWRHGRSSNDGTLTAEDVERVVFSVTKLREGYDKGEVDSLLGDIAATLRHAPSQRAVSAHEVLDVKLSSTRFREGYDQDEVDDFLDEVVSTLRRLAEGVATADADDATCPHCGSTSTAPIHREVIRSDEGLWKRLADQEVLGSRHVTERDLTRRCSRCGWSFVNPSAP